MPISRRTFIDRAAALLSEAGIDRPRDEARALLDAAAGISLSSQLTSPDAWLTESERMTLEEALAKRRARVPLTQIVGESWFYGLPFVVTGDTLSPRPESELLVDAAIDYACGCSLPKTAGEGDTCQGRLSVCDGHATSKTADEGDVGLSFPVSEHSRSSVAVLDAFAGTGAVGIAIAWCLLDRGLTCTLTMTDISRPALAVAEQNARRLIPGAACDMELADIWPAAPRRYDIITANPPYIATEEIAGLMPEVSLYEPASALDGGRDGLDFYRRLAAEAGSFLADGGVLFIEIGAGQEEEVVRLFSDRGAWSGFGQRKDLAGHTRMLAFQTIW